MANSIALKDQNAAEAWIAKAQALNEKAHDANVRIGQLLVELGQKAAGDIVDKFVEYGTKLLKKAEEILRQMTEIANTIRNVINTIKETLGGLLNAARSIIGRT